MTVPIRVVFDIEASKVTKYLLEPAYPLGGPKARFLMRFGFPPQDPNTLAAAPVDHAINKLPGVRMKRPKGPDRIVLEGTVTAPDGRRMPLRTVWEPRGDPLTMRFITAVPPTC